MNTLDTITRAAQLGLATGLRSMTPLAVITTASQAGRLQLPTNGPFSLLRRREVAVVFTLAAVGEGIADIALPLPPRTQPGPLAGRLLLGGVAGAAISASARPTLMLSASVAALAAALSTFGGFAGRHLLTERGVPDAVVALTEDGLCLALALAALTRR